MMRLFLLRGVDWCREMRKVFVEIISRLCYNVCTGGRDYDRIF